MLRGERACRTCYEDATSKLLPWNLGITELKFNEVPQFHLTQTRPDIKTYNTINTLKTNLPHATCATRLKKYSKLHTAE